MRRLFRRLGFKVHIWRYRNPYSRTCAICGHQQDYYVRQFNDWVDPIGWEDMYQPAPRVCAPPKEPAP